MPTFLITVSVDCELNEYTSTSGEIVNALHTVMTDSEQMDAIIGSFDDANVEVGVKFEREQAVARAVLHYTSEASKQFDKSKFTAALKAAGLTTFKLRKQAVSDDEVARMTLQEPGHVVPVH